MSGQLAKASHLYAALAPGYDAETKFITGIRKRAVAALRLQPGETVLDAGCGTGWCLPMLSSGVHEAGHVMGFDPSPEMLAHAHARVVAQKLPNVTLLQACGETVALDRSPDVILFSYTHDLIRSRASLQNIFRQARSGTRIVSTGTQLFPTWFFLGNWYLRKTHQMTITDFDGFDQPWTRLAECCPDCYVRTSLPGSRYLFEGRLA